MYKLRLRINNQSYLNNISKYISEVHVIVLNPFLYLFVFLLNLNLMVIYIHSIYDSDGKGTAETRGTVPTTLPPVYYDVSSGA